MLLLPLLAIAACETERKPLTGYDKPPPGILLGDDGAALLLWPIFDLPPERQDHSSPGSTARRTVILTSTFEGFYNYDYVSFPLKGWTGGFGQGLGRFPAGTYVVELVDRHRPELGQVGAAAHPPAHPTPRASFRP